MKFPLRASKKNKSPLLVLPPPLTGIPCWEKNCVNSNAYQCAFGDNRQHRCKTAWCESHTQVYNGLFYCRRHASIAAALDKSESSGHFPDLDNRAPSLVNWVGEAISNSVENILTSVIENPSIEFVQSDPICFIFKNSEQSHRWERIWKLSSHTGVLVRVAIEVDEEFDFLVTLRVGGQVCQSTTPPWVAHHMHRDLITLEQDEDERQQYYARLLSNIAQAVRSERTRDKHPLFFEFP